MVKLAINDQQVEVPKGTTKLEAAGELGIHIPTLCYHKALSPYGACRVCLVETSLRGRTELKTACNNVVLDGMSVMTSTPRVLETRRVVVELLLARSPDSEKILQIASDLGIRETSFSKKEDACILCGLCGRVCEERMGRSAINFAGRGIERAIVAPFDKQTAVCQTCGACVSVCPTGAMDLSNTTSNKPRPLTSDFDAGLSPRHPIYITYPQAVPNWATIDKEHCVHLLTGECGICKDVCEADAIDYDQKPEKVKLDVGAIVVTPGFDEFMADLEYDYGYSRFDDVVSSMEFERILSATGPSKGHVQRMSDGKEPKKIAFLQCVGSRNTSCRNSYCSSVCCMYAIKEAVIAKEHMSGSLDVTVFFMDMRAFGKDFDKYFERAKSQYGITFVRARVSDICQPEGSDQLAVQYSPAAGQVVEDQFDMVVLSVGFEPAEKSRQLAKRLGVKLGPNGFVWTRDSEPLQTSRPGIYVGGVASGPKDIPETVTQASGAAGKASQLLAEARDSLTVEKEFPPERDVAGQEPRIGVFICHCGINIGGVVDVPAVTEYAQTLPNVVYAENNLYTCSQDTQGHISEMILEHNLNRVIVASCTPRTHEPLFRDTVREAGLNPYLFEMANIRDQCSWVHMREPENATEKARDLVNMAVAKARGLEQLYSKPMLVKSGALVIGGGIAGMTASLSLAEQGFQVNLVEREKELGGNLKHLHYFLGDDDPKRLLKETVKKVNDHPNLKVWTGANVVSVDGFVGNFFSRIEREGKQVEVEHGVVIVATGAGENKPTEYLYGTDDKITTQRGLEAKLASGEFSAKAVVMIQCVGSREEGHMYCSRVCCSSAVKNALKIKDVSPETEVYVLYRDMRTYGFIEECFQEARDKGVLFVRYEPDKKPEVSNNGSLKVRVTEPLLQRDLVLHPDLLVLSSRIDANKDNEELTQMLKVPMNEDGFFLEAHMKLRPVDFAVDGVFLAGMAHGPKNVSETIAQADAAAGRAATVISKKEYVPEAIVSEVDEDLCAACGLCVSICAYDAPEIVEVRGRRLSRINTALCKGCGACAMACPSGAVQQLGFKPKQITEMVDAALELVGSDPKIINKLP